jgi:YD repeat-containing protein
VREVKSKNDSVTVKYRYDATGNRIEKKVETWKSTRTTRYVRDASSNVMAIYRDSTVTERPIYGSSRLGEYRGNVPEGTQTLGYRYYELSNHLGNVLTVITDNIHMNTSDTTRAVVSSVSDYYPFGLNMKERSWQDTTISKFRYGFNGKEKDDFAFTQSLKGETVSHENLIGDYELNGDGNDASNSGNNGTVYGSPVATIGHDGTTGSAIEMDGVDDYVEIADSPALDFGSDDFTVSIWIKKISPTSSWNNSIVVAKHVSGGSPGNNEWAITTFHRFGGQSDSVLCGEWNNAPQRIQWRRHNPGFMVQHHR